MVSKYVRREAVNTSNTCWKLKSEANLLRKMRMASNYLGPVWVLFYLIVIVNLGGVRIVISSEYCNLQILGFDTSHSRLESPVPLHFMLRRPPRPSASPVSATPLSTYYLSG